MRKTLCILFFVNIFFTPTGFGQDVIKNEIAFRSGDQLLTGTLLLPVGAQNIPVLLFLGGVDEWGDYNENRASFISENLESIFPPSGIGVLYYNPRGLESSSGKWQRSNFQEFADDAKAAVHYLQQRKEVNPARIGIIGHGEDAWVAQIVAADIPDEIRLLISLAGSPFDATKQLINEYHNNYVCDGEDSDDAYTKAEQKANSHENWVSIFPITKRWRHMKMKQDFDPSESLQQIRIPSLLLFGQNDGDVYPSWALEKLTETFGNSLPPNFTVQVIPGANHYFKVADRCYENGEGSLSRNYSYRFKEVLREWIFEHI